MEGIAAYADEGSNPSVNDEGSDQEEMDRADVMDAVDDNAEDGYRGKDLVHADYGYEQKEEEDDSQEPVRQHTSEVEAYEEEEEEGELSPSVKKDSEVASSQEEGNNEDSNLDASDKNGLEEEEEEGERVLPQEVTTPFSLASFLTNMAPEITDDAPSRDQEKDRDLEFAYVNGTYVRVAKYKVDMEDLDRRLDDLRQQRREERGLLRMYGLDENEDQGGGGGGRGGRNDDSRGSRDGRDKNRDGEDGRRRSRSRSRDRDRDRRRSRSRERRRSRSRDRRRSRSRDRSSRRDRESPDRSRGRDDKDRFGRDKDRFGRDRDDKDRSGREKDRFGRDKDRFGRDRQEHSRDRDREDRKDEREHGRSKSPRSDRRDTNNRDRPSGGRGQEGNNQFRDEEKQRHDSQELSMYGDQRGSGRQESSFSGGQDFYPSQQPPPPVPVPPPETFPHSQFQGPQGGAFSQPPPQLDPFSTSVPPPQPWIPGAGFQPQQPPPHLLGSGGYTQPPPPLPAGLGAVNNGDINTLQKNLSMLTGASEVNTGSPAMSGSASYGGMVQEPSQPPMGYSGYGRDTGFSDSVVDDDPMDLDLPSNEESDDFQNRVVDEVKNAIRPFFSNGQISKDDYKEILKKCVPKVANSGEINRKKISNLVGAYVKKMKGQGRPK